MSRLLGVCFFLSSLLASAQTNLPDGTGKDTFIRVCGQCHEAGIVSGLKKSPAGWSVIVDDMIAKGASGTDEEIRQVLAYLNKNFAKSASPKIEINTAPAKELEQSLELSSTDAQSIVHYREEHGKFKSWDDLKKVPGLDTAKLESKREQIVF